MKSEPISKFKGEYKFLSNFYLSPFVYEETYYKTVEHAYQERKFNNPNIKEQIRDATDAMSAARLGRRPGVQKFIRPDWPNIKGLVMMPIVRAKFYQKLELKDKLLATDEAYLLEGNYWHDNYFGICTCRKCHDKGVGQNMLGRILMQVRDELR